MTVTVAETASALAEDAERFSRLVEQVLPVTTQVYNERDTVLYALGLGLGGDPCDAQQLRFVQGDEVAALPTMAAVLASPTEWMRLPSLGIRWQQLVALSHALTTLRPLPCAGHVASHARVTEVFDRGADRGAVIHWERELVNESDGEVLAVLSGRALARGNGGFGGRPAPPRHDDAAPESTAPLKFRWRTWPMQALVYRLSGDLNPLHADPEVARAAGFERPILHGLCSLGICSWALISRLCDGDPSALRRIEARYAGVAYPGEMLEIEMWPLLPEARFRCRAVERDVVVLEGGRAQFSI